MLRETRQGGGHVDAKRDSAGRGHVDAKRDSAGPFAGWAHCY